MRKLAMRFLPYLPLILFFNSVTSLLHAAIPQQERDALIVLYNGTNGPGWTNRTGWLGAAGSECTWYGVTCDAGGSTVIALSLSGNQLSGNISPELGNLTNLQGLVLTGNLLSGSIPSTLGNLSKLQQLWLHSNQLSGSIPPELGNLANLQELHLNANRLSGSIPSSLGALSNLRVLRLHFNELSGSIPPSFGNLVNLVSLMLSGNRLSGSIPAELGVLSNLQYLYAESNQLSGSLPPSLGNLKNLLRLWLDSNRLSGSIPSSFASLTKLEIYIGLNLGYNALYAVDPGLITFLNSKAPGWQYTQTVAPSNVKAAALGKTAIDLSWTPILYTAGSGGYRISRSTSYGGPFTLIHTTADKSVSKYTAASLSPDTTYYFRMQSFTNANANNANDLDSDPSEAVQGITGADGPTFTLSVSYASAMVPRNNPGTFNLRLDAQNGFAESVTLSTSGFPPGTSRYSPTNIVNLTPQTSPGVVVFTFTPSNAASLGDYPVLFNADSTGVHREIPITLTVDASPSVTSLSPTGVTAGSAGFTLTANGTGFVQGVTKVVWNDYPLTTAYVNATQVTAAIDPLTVAVPGNAAVRVTNGTITSNTLFFPVRRQAVQPKLTRISPTIGIIGGPSFDLYVYGTDFNAESVLQWNGANRPTTFLTSGELRAEIPSGDLQRTGSAAVTVVNPGPLQSGAVAFDVVGPAPILTSLTPPAVTAGDAGFTLTVYGLNFTPLSVVEWNGSARGTTFVDNFTLTAAIPAGDIVTGGTSTVTVLNPPGTRSNSKTVIAFVLIAGGPRISSLDPNQVTAGGAGFTLTVKGTGFRANSRVQWNGQDRATTYVSDTELRAAILASDIAEGGAFYVNVINPVSSAPFEDGTTGDVSNPGLGVSTNPVPLITALSPSSVTAGGAGYTQGIAGLGITKGTYVNWKGSQQLGVYESNTRLTVNVAAGDVGSEGVIEFWLFNPKPGGGTSNSQTLTIRPKMTMQTELYYPRLASSAGDSDNPSEVTGIALVNLGAADAQVELWAMNADGTEMKGEGITNPIPIRFARSEQRAIQDSELFGKNLPQQGANGWLRLKSDQAQVSGFFLTYDNSVAVMDGADVGSEVMTTIIFPEIEGEGTTRLQVVNPGSTAATLQLELRKGDGTLRSLTVVEKTVNPGGVLTEEVGKLFADAKPESTDYVRVTSNRGVAGFEYLGKQWKYGAGVNGQDGMKGAATLYCPQYVVGGAAYRSMLSVVNLDGTAGTVKLSFIGNDGKVLGAERTASIAGYGKLRIADQKYFLDAGSSTVDGYVVVTTSGVKLAGSVVFGDQGGESYEAALPLVSGLKTSLVFGQVASGGSYFTGAAMANPSATEANYTLEVYASDGKLVGKKTGVIPPRGRSINLLTGYFEGLAPVVMYSGYIRVVSDRGLAAFALFGTSNGTALSAVPAQTAP